MISGARLDSFRLERRRATVDWSAVLGTRPGIHLVEVEHASVRIRTAGAGGTPLLFLCDPPNVVEQYDEVIALLAPRFRVVVMEQPGFGFSFPRRGFGFTLDEYADALVRVIEALALGPLVVVSPCVSSYAAMRAATKSPSAIRGLVMMQATSWTDQKHWLNELAKSMVAGTLGVPFGNAIGAIPFLGQALFAMTEAWFPQLTHPFAVYRAKQRPAVLDKFVAAGRDAFRRGACNCMPSLYQHYFDGDPGVGPLALPALVLWATCDYWHDNRNVDERFPGYRGYLLRAVMREVRSDARGLLNYVPDAAFAEIENTGHHLELENPHDVCRHIDAFIRREIA